VFSVAIPVRYAASITALTVEAPELDSSRIPILIVEDHYETRLAYDRYLRGSGYQFFFARSVAEARNVLRNIEPRAILLDVLLNQEDSWGLLAELKSSGKTRGVPIVVISEVEDPHKVYGLGADEYAVKPIDKDWLLRTLGRLTRQTEGRRILLIDDDEVFRYLLRQLFSGRQHRFQEAGDAIEGLALAREARPDVIFLDLTMPGTDGFEVLRRLRGDAEVSGIPVVVVTSKVLTAADSRQLASAGAAVVSKEAFSSGKVAAEMRQILETMHLEDLFAVTESGS
jgi:CheY-like chemotaxis protein